MLCIISVVIWGCIFLLTYVYMKLLSPVFGEKMSEIEAEAWSIDTYFFIRTIAEYHGYLEMVNNVSL